MIELDSEYQILCQCGCQNFRALGSDEWDHVSLVCPDCGATHWEAHDD